LRFWDGSVWTWHFSADGTVPDEPQRPAVAPPPVPPPLPPVAPNVAQDLSNLPPPDPAVPKNDTGSVVPDAVPAVGDDWVSAVGLVADERPPELRVPPTGPPSLFQPRPPDGEQRGPDSPPTSDSDVIVNQTLAATAIDPADRLPSSHRAMKRRLRSALSVFAVLGAALVAVQGYRMITEPDPSLAAWCAAMEGTNSAVDKDLVAAVEEYGLEGRVWLVTQELAVSVAEHYEEVAAVAPYEIRDESETVAAGARDVADRLARLEIDEEKAELIKEDEEVFVGMVADLGLDRVRGGDSYDEAFTEMLRFQYDNCEPS
jgi:hypothetical protein